MNIININNILNNIVKKHNDNVFFVKHDGDYNSFTILDANIFYNFENEMQYNIKNPLTTFFVKIPDDIINILQKHVNTHCVLMQIMTEVCRTNLTFLCNLDGFDFYLIKNSDAFDIKLNI